MQHEAEDDWVFTGQDEVPRTVRRVMIAEGITRIPDEAFEKHPELEEFTLSSSVREIGYSAFYLCKKLKFIFHEDVGQEKKLGIPSTVKVIDDFAFIWCRNLKSLCLNEGHERIGHDAFQGCEGLTMVDIPSTVKVIDDRAFAGCKNLESLCLNEGLERIGIAAFGGCEGLTMVGIPSTVQVIDYSAFARCKSLASLCLNEGLERIEHSAFQGCEGLTKVDIPSTVKVIDTAAFRMCTRLHGLSLNEGLERIGKWAFYGCALLTRVDIPSTVVVIGNVAFARCRSLSHIRIPSSVAIIAKDAFLECRSLISIELPGDESSFDIDLSGCSSLVNVAGPISTIIPEGFFQDSMLGRVVQDEADLVHRLNHRFDNSPLNNLCYYQSYHSSEDAMVQLHSLMEDDPLPATNQTDMFGMTPLHVVSLSQTPNMDMLLKVMNDGNLDHIVHSRDSFGSTAMDYLCLNRMPNSTEVIRRVLYTRFEDLLDLNRSWESETMRQAVNEALAVEFSSRGKKIVSIYLKLANYELKVMLSLLELRLWKSGGAALVNVLQFLDTFDVEDYFAVPA